MQIGLQMYTLHDFTKTREGYTDTVRRVSELGFRSVQATKPAFFTDEEFSALLRANGLQADSLLVREGQILGNEKTLCERAKLYGVTAARIDGIPQPLRTSVDGYKKYAEMLNAEGKACRECGLKLMIHNHVYEWQKFGGKAGFQILVEESDPEYVWFQPDVYWIAAAGYEPSETLRIFAGRTFSIHVDDYAIQPREVYERVPMTCVPVGEGNMNYKGIIATAQEIGVERVVIEQEATDGDIFADLGVNIRNLSALGCVL